MDVQEIWDNVTLLVTEYGIKLVLAIVILLVGKWLARIVTALARKSLDKRGMEATIAGFACNIIYALLMTIVIVATLGQLGIQTASFVAIIGAAGLAVGLALQGSLANFAAGVLMVLFRPCKVGDFIEAAGTAGTVDDISIFTTTLKTPDNKTIIAPNAAIMGGNIVNYSAQTTRRIDMLVGVSYEADLRKAKAVITALVGADERVLRDPEPTIAVSELADSSVNFVVRPWVNSADYWAVKFDLTEKIKLTLDEEGIGIPFPQMDVHLHKLPE